MKVLQINSVCGVGSTGRIVTDLYKVLEEQGHECVIAYGRGKAPDGIKTIKIGSDFDNYMHVAKTRIFDKHGFGSKNATKEFIKKVEEYDPDVIHLHNIHGYYINIEILFDYLKRSNKKVIWTLHDCWAFTGHCSHFDYIGCNKWKRGCNDCPQKNEYPNSILKDNSEFNYLKKRELITSLNDLTIVTPSKWLANLVKQSFLNKYNIKIINNGIDLNIFKPRKSNFKKLYNIEDKKIILGVANVWSRKKGLNYFIELANVLDKEYKIVLVGVNKKQKKELPKDIITIDKTNNVIELAEIYTMAYCFFNPTLEDTYPTTNLEALACGCPVVTFNTGGSIESIDRNTGLVIRKEELVNFIDKIKNIDRKSCIKKSLDFNKYKRYNEYVNLYFNRSF